MTNKHRVNIVREARARIKTEVKDYDDLLSGQKEDLEVLITLLINYQLLIKFVHT
jgi:hypothetical protein